MLFLSSVQRQGVALPVSYDSRSEGFKNPGARTVGGNITRMGGDLVMWGWFGTDVPPRVSTSRGIALPQSLWAEIESPLGYWAELSLVVRNDRLVCTRMEIGAVADTDVAVERLVSDLRLDEVVADIAAASAWIESEDEDGSIVQQRATEADRDRVFNAVRDPQSRNIAVPDLREVADVYQGALAAAEARGEKVARPTKEISDRWHVSRATASRWVRAARDRGLLPAAVERKAG